MRYPRQAPKNSLIKEPFTNSQFIKERKKAILRVKSLILLPTFRATLFVLRQKKKHYFNISHQLFHCGT